MKEFGILRARLYFSITELESGIPLWGNKLGPEATDETSPAEVSEIIKLICFVFGAARASPPPLISEIARLTEFISAIFAPDVTKI